MKIIVNQCNGVRIIFHIFLNIVETRFSIWIFHSKKITYFSGEVYSIQHYVIKFVSDLRQVDGFLRVLQFPPPIKLVAMI